MKTFNMGEIDRMLRVVMKRVEFIRLGFLIIWLQDHKCVKGIFESSRTNIFWFLKEILSYASKWLERGLRT